MSAPSAGSSRHSTAPTGCGSSSPSARPRRSDRCDHRPRLRPLDIFAGTLAMFPDAQIDFSHVAAIVGRVSPALRCSLGSFARSSSRSLFPASLAPDGASARDPWPLPPPPVPPARCLRSGRARERERVRRSAVQLVQQAVIALNWLTLGHPSDAPPSIWSICVGAPCSAAQSAMIASLLRQASIAVRVSRKGDSDLGRALSKLCSAETSLRSLGDAVSALSQTMVGSSLIPSSVRLPDDDSLTDAACWRDVSAATVDLEVQASQIKWALPPSFDPEPFLPPDLLAAYRDPEVLRLPRDSWPDPLPPARVHASRADLEALVRKLDEAGALSLIPRDEVADWDEACGLFRVAKDAEHDRLILNPTVINSRMSSLSRSTKRLGVGFLLTRLELAEGEWYELSSDDLREFYYTFRVTEARARRNVLRTTLSDSFARTLRAWRPDLAGRTLRPALAVLATGDNLAVEIAQSAHEGLLRSIGALQPECRLIGRQPVPRA